VVRNTRIATPPAGGGADRSDTMQDQALLDTKAPSRDKSEKYKVVWNIAGTAACYAD
jgi:hypothetical protein